MNTKYILFVIVLFVIFSMIYVFVVINNSQREQFEKDIKSIKTENVALTKQIKKLEHEKEQNKNIVETAKKEVYMYQTYWNQFFKED